MKFPRSSMIVAALALAASAAAANAGVITFSITAVDTTSGAPLTAVPIGDTVAVTVYASTNGVGAGAYNSILMGLQTVNGTTNVTTVGPLVFSADGNDSFPSLAALTSPATVDANGDAVYWGAAGALPTASNVSSTPSAAQKVGLNTAVAIWTGNFTATAAGTTSFNVTLPSGGANKDYLAKAPTGSSTAGKMTVGLIADTINSATQVSSSVTVIAATPTDVNEFVAQATPGGANGNTYATADNLASIADGRVTPPAIGGSETTTTSQKTKGQVEFTGLTTAALGGGTAYALLDLENTTTLLPAGTLTGAQLNPAWITTFGSQFNAAVPLVVAGGVGYLAWDFNGATPIANTVNAVALVPEPASLGLLAIGAMGLLARRRK